MLTRKAKRSTPLVMVVDDDQAVRLLARETLENSGFAVRDVENGEQALEEFDVHAPDIVLLDVMMPGIDGFSVCSAIRRTASGRDTPVLMMTGLDDLESIDCAYEAGATDFITKPINWHVLGYRVSYMLRASGALEQLRESRAGLAHAQSLAHIGSWEWDLVTGEIRCSEEVYSICSIERSFKGGNPILDPVHPLDRGFVQGSIDEAIGKRAPLSFDYRITLGGGERTLHAELVTVLDEQGEAVCLTGTIQDITERKRAEEQIRLLAYYDALTGLPNRRFFLQQLEQALVFANRYDRMLAVLFLDLDRFKLVNDTLGHGVGDRLLQDVADRLLRCVRRGDCLARADEECPPSLVSRLGGDEFTIMLSDIEHFQDVAKIARRILEAVSVPYSLEGQEVFVSTSIGISLYPFDATTASDLIRNADGAMYQAKEQGRNGYQIYDESMNAKALERIILESQLHKALKEEEFIVYYQPQVSNQSGRVVGIEALVRWNSKELGLVEPGRFLPLAEEIGLVIQIDQWVMREACRQHKLWLDAGFPPVTLAINISGQQFMKNELLETVTSVLKESGLDPGLLELELTEGVLMAHTERTVKTLQALKGMGVRLAIDDFGTGFSSLSYLKRFPLDVLKIDRTFINDITTDPDDAAITLATIEMAHTMKLKVIAEGVETKPQLDFLTKNGCDMYQGYLFSKPVPSTELPRLFNRWQ
ncbi:response receiver sensor diguanylate cyclase/phosphodiesterase, PAS domain-containing [Citrifermentans bemidjiense Bem]|uniref:Response receiver sensor diguanylate cyclase/phosphodiesterase, PAS domain-containing n=1 Tax=Citrifermentans bemidjiense (strain ATCC BAA-1014 / DSM 16622 / JCM 12645 / Bem) TaxID=404380 RepID=B5E7Y8_CITBB|nr:EAL domain-containing protein [Citrifermentans bemidjiense]ACH38524.1 response receiver sensor diguanylate cyclase/phosphodiesterase, PAS domain-containing [Citrifermentans bemidjiense Bem]